MSDPKEAKTVKVELDNVHHINGVEYGEGTHEVSPELAEDLVRNDKNYNKYLAQLNKNVSSNGNGGSRSAA